jgi:hypothetical protein
MPFFVVAILLYGVAAAVLWFIIYTAVRAAIRADRDTPFRPLPRESRDH